MEEKKRIYEYLYKDSNLTGQFLNARKSYNGLDFIFKNSENEIEIYDLEKAKKEKPYELLCFLENSIVITEDDNKNIKQNTNKTKKERKGKERKVTKDTKDTKVTKDTKDTKDTKIINRKGKGKKE